MLHAININNKKTEVNIKKLTLIIILALSSFALSAQSACTCLPEGIIFTTQADINNFTTNYPNCTEIEGNVIIDGSNINNLNGLNVLTAFGGNIYIVNNDSLNSLTGLENLTTIGGDMRIAGNPILNSLTALENIAYIPGSLELGAYYNSNYHGNFSLNNLTGLENLDSIGGGLYIYQNPVLENLNALENIKKIGYSLKIGGMWSGGNSSLSNLVGLNNLISIGGNLNIVANSSLKDLSGLNNLTSIENGLYIYYNDSLTSLSGLNNLNSIGGSLIIGIVYYGPMGNPSLNDITSLANVSSIGGNLKIIGNDVLSTCHVKSICDYLASPGGTIEIHDNATGCNSPEEVEEACETTAILDLSSEEKFIISPNPLESSTLIQYTLHHN